MTPTISRPLALSGALAVAALFAAALLHSVGAEPAPADTAAPKDTNGAISPRDEADALHYVIAADREALCQSYADHPAGAQGAPRPCPSLMLRAASESIQVKGAEFSFALRSPHPLGPRNGAQTDLEQAGLMFIAGHPDQAYFGQEMLGGRRYFTAVYPDLPAAAACIGCHSHNKAGDRLGAVVVRVPLEF